MIGQIVPIENLNTLEVFKLALHELVSSLRQCPNINEIVVFGSVAKGCAHGASDIDLCIFSDICEYDLLTDPVVTNTFFNLIEQGIVTSVDTLVYTNLEELQEIAGRTTASVEKSILREGISLYRKGEKLKEVMQ